MTGRLTQALALVIVCIVGAANVLAETTTYQYDELHRLIHVTYDDGSWIRYEYDAVGNRLLEVMNSDPGVGYVHITADPPGSGTVGRDPDEVWYAVDSSIDLTPVGTGVCTFEYWSGDGSEGHEDDVPLTITMSATNYMHVVAHFDSTDSEGQLHMDQDCNSDGIPDGCQWADLNDNDVLDLCDPLIGRTAEPVEPSCLWSETALDQTFEIWNAGLPGTVLNYEITDDADWLWCEYDGDPLGDDDDPAIITVHFDGTELLDCGEYQAVITITDSDAGNAPQTVDVNLSVIGYSEICDDTQMVLSSCVYGGVAPDREFDLWNCGPPGTVMDYGITEEINWLWCEWPGLPLTDESATVTVHYDCDELPAGQHWGTIGITAAGASNDPQEVPAVLTVACPVDGWLPWDLNYDGIVTILGEVPPFVDCVYFSDCDCPGPGCLCPGDCDSSGFLSIIGDVQCFVDCVYFNDCETRRSVPRLVVRDAFTIGGAIYSDLTDPLGSGVAGVRIRVLGLAEPTPVDGAASNTALGTEIRTLSGKRRPSPSFRSFARTGEMGLWQVDGLSPGRYSVVVMASGRTFQHVLNGVPHDGNTVDIIVGMENQAANQSIQFLASE